MLQHHVIAIGFKCWTCTEWKTKTLNSSLHICFGCRSNTCIVYITIVIDVWEHTQLNYFMCIYNIYFMHIVRIFSSTKKKCNFKIDYIENATANTSRTKKFSLNWTQRHFNLFVQSINGFSVVSKTFKINNQTPKYFNNFLTAVSFLFITVTNQSSILSYSIKIELTLI